MEDALGIPGSFDDETNQSTQSAAYANNEPDDFEDDFEDDVGMIEETAPEETAKRQRTLEDMSEESKAQLSNKLVSATVKLLQSVRSLSPLDIEVLSRKMRAMPLGTQLTQFKSMQLKIQQQQQARARDLAVQQQQHDALQQQRQALLLQQQAQLRELQRQQAEKEMERRQLEEDGILGEGNGENADVLEQQTTAEEHHNAKQPVFSTYEPMKVKLGKDHPEPIVESCSMACVEPPDAYYEPALPLSLLQGTKGLGHSERALSAAQLESVVYAGQRHMQENADGSRRGFFIGDGTGVGKGRQIAAIIIDNYIQGRRRAIWCTISTSLLDDCRRDLHDLGRDDINCYPLHKMPYGDLPLEVEDGVIFCTYPSLIAQSRDGQTRMNQLIAWAAQAVDGGDEQEFDGCLVFDESHRAKNIATKTGGCVLELQDSLPKARVVYVSATAAADVKDLGYMTRLGLWGRGTPFRDFNDFASSIEKAGVGAMELLAMDMKARGMFVSRMLAFDGCSFEKRECVLEPEQRSIYDDLTNFWEEMLQAFERCSQLASNDMAARSYWSAHQNCFKQLLNSIKAKFAIREAEEALRNDMCVVIGLISTGEAKANEAAEREARFGRELEGEVSTPHEIARDLLEKHLALEDNEEVEALRRDLLDKLESMKSRMPGNALDLIVSAFGPENVAEMTGRKHRLVTKDGNTTREMRAGPGVNQDQVNNLEKRETAPLPITRQVAIISDAASMGISLHADPRFPNTRKRLHITLELAWSADKVLQQFGRTHRSNQVCAPHYLMLVTDVGGEQRFASSVARRIELLGAITRGDRRGGHGAAGELVQLNLDTAHGHAALALTLDAIAENVEKQELHDEALKGMMCHREGVPTLLGLCVVAVAQLKARKPSLSISRLPPEHQQYVVALCNIARKRKAESNRVPPREKSTYGECPKSPYPKMTWMQAQQALVRMRMDNLKEGNDKYDINKFLNRLLGLPLKEQNALFDYYTQVYRWVVITAKSQGKMDVGITVIDGESVSFSAEPEVIFKDPTSTSITVHYSLEVDTGLSFQASLVARDDVLTSRSIKSNIQGGGTGFWQQSRSSRIILALEVASSTQKGSKMYRVLRPTWHLSKKPQYTRGKELNRRYAPVRDMATAEELWSHEYDESITSRIQQVHLLCGAVLPIWNPLQEVLRKKHSALSVRRSLVDGKPVIGVFMQEKEIDILKKRLSELEGGTDREVKHIKPLVSRPTARIPGKEPPAPAPRPSKAKQFVKRLHQKHIADKTGGGRGGGGRVTKRKRTSDGQVKEESAADSAEVESLKDDEAHNSESSESENEDAEEPSMVFASVPRATMNPVDEADDDEFDDDADMLGAEKVGDDQHEALIDDGAVNDAEASEGGDEIMHDDGNGDDDDDEALLDLIC
ncbi:hypothetical protein AB1Y20_010904 [Prymnesium parvum]|uniref:Uncharacterized protein n=1 Tax=Prymnesium parvum TaxID=97485 RepID=A0AB34IQ30_PRYPA